MIELGNTEKAAQLLDSLVKKSDRIPALALKLLAGIDFKNGRFLVPPRSDLPWNWRNLIMRKKLMAELQGRFGPGF